VSRAGMTLMTPLERCVRDLVRLELEDAAALGEEEQRIVRVGDQQPVVTVDGQAARPVDVEVGSAPAAEVPAVAVEDLDPVGQVGDIKVVVAVEDTQEFGSAVAAEANDSDGRLHD